MSRRVQRLNEQLKREISHVLRGQAHDPRVVDVTVTAVQVAPDLTSAKVWVRRAGPPERRQEALEGLEAAAPFIRRQLGAALRIRRVPELDFREDRSLERARRIEEILKEVRPEGSDGEEGEDGEDEDEGGAPDT